MADRHAKGVVWPGVTAFPDWFNPDTQTYWNNEFDSFFSADSGVDIDGLWIDMNEASVSIYLIPSALNQADLALRTSHNIPTGTPRVLPSRMEILPCLPLFAHPTLWMFRDGQQTFNTNARCLRSSESMSPLSTARTFS